MQELYEFANSRGFQVSDITPDGNIHRFNRKGHRNAWYVAYQIFGTKSGNPYYVMVLGDWKTSEKFEYKSFSKEKYSRDDLTLINKKLREATEKAEADRIQRQQEVSEKSTEIIEKCTLATSTPYSVKKKISVSFLCEKNEIVLPMRDIDGKLWGYQRITADGKKFFQAGQRVAATFYTIGKFEGAKTIYIVEGFATGSSVFEATRQPVVVAFNASNLVAVARSIRQRYPDITLIICGDDDFKTEGNPGRTKAEEAAKLAYASAIFPAFSGEQGTDFNDLHCLEGIEAVKAQLSQSESVSPNGFYCLGFLDSRHFFLHKATNTIKVLSSFSSVEFFSLMPLEYWEACYPGKKGIDWDQAKSYLITQSNAVGVFDPLRVRGAGVWLEDDGRVIVNHGMSEIADSNYIYLSNKKRFLTETCGPASVTETRHLVACCEALKWREPNFGKYLAGWLAVSRIAGALPIRPHIWLTGASGSGKSTVMERIVNPALGHPGGRLYVTGPTTEAGIRQTIRADSLPLIFDEFETTGENSKQRIESIVELLRLSWSSSSGHIIKGSSGGVSSLFSVCCPALVSSIRTNLTNDADRSRFAIIELESGKSDPIHWKELKKNLEQITEKFGERLFQRQLKNVHTIMTNFDLISERLARIVNQRFGQQYGMLMAGYASLIKDAPVSPLEADELVRNMGIEETDVETDEQACLTWLMEYSRQFYIDVGGEKRTNVHKSVSEIIDEGDQCEIQQLKTIGILVSDNHLYISSNHANLKRLVFGNTRWENCWYQTLCRLPNASKAKGAKRFGFHVSYAVKIPLVST